MSSNLNSDPEIRSHQKMARKKLPKVLVIVQNPYHTFRCRNLKQARRIQGQNPGSKMLRVKMVHGNLLWRPTK